MLDRLVGGSIAEPIEAVGNVLDKLFTSDDEKLDKQAVLERLRQNPYKWQTEINKIEAQHRTIFVAGWRPAIGWVGALALLYNFIGYPILAWFSAYYDPTIIPPKLETDNLFEIVLAMLGIGAFRSYEKVKGVTK